MTPQPGKQAIAIHKLPDISRSKGNQTMTFDHLIEYNMRITLLIFRFFSDPLSPSGAY